MNHTTLVGTEKFQFCGYVPANGKDIQSVRSIHVETVVHLSRDKGDYAFLFIRKICKQERTDKHEFIKAGTFMKKTVLCVEKILLSAATFPLWFVKMFKGVGHLPNQETGEIVEVIFRHSMFENIGDAAHSIFAYISMAVAIAAVVLNAIVLKCPNAKRMQTISNIIFWSAIGLFLILLLFASSVARGY